ncbi:hypothetical protein SAMN05216378_3629 [Paenibacillus catalpae]|uniref:Uncharacterized protein n=1 Tax=Paenibacillus catalpae TaxID=1045775 RepID=A0A1I2BT67_9BACL|nr:hypothetical protein [Paenibacillus catalpae]SFE58553.1 hypothetical protein SAMN05216378_3629 [Paenibacillus catalpae]
MTELISFIFLTLAFLSGPFLIVLFGRMAIRGEELLEAESKLH